VAGAGGTAAAATPVPEDGVGAAGLVVFEAQETLNAIIDPAATRRENLIHFLR
jgi:hypothetical protein